MICVKLSKNESTAELVLPCGNLILSERLDGSRIQKAREILSYCIKKRRLAKPDEIKIHNIMLSYQYSERNSLPKTNRSINSFR
jgi:hypothetical protein